MKSEERNTHCKLKCMEGAVRQKYEVRISLAKMKRKRDDINIMLTASDYLGANNNTEMICEIYDSSHKPEGLLTTVFVTLP